MHKDVYRDWLRGGIPLRTPKSTFEAKESLPTSGIMLDLRSDSAPDRHISSQRSFCRATYRNLLSDYKYNRLREVNNYETLRRTLRYFCKSQIRPYVPGKGHGPLYDGKGTKAQLEAKRNKFITLAKEYDLSHPLEMWCAMVQKLEQPNLVVDFYPTLEELLVEYLDGMFYIEVFTNGAVRIIKAGQSVSIFHLSPAGVAEYRRLRNNQVTDLESKQNLYIFTCLLVTKGYMFTPGPKFLSVKEKDWCRGEGSAYNTGYHRDHDKYTGCKKNI